MALVIPMESVFGLQDANIGISLESEDVVGSINSLEGVLVIGESVSVQERGGDLDASFPISQDETLDLDGLAAVAVHEKYDLGFGAANIAHGQRRYSIAHSETVGKMSELEEVAVNGIREDTLYDNGEVHRRLHLHVSAFLEDLSIVFGDRAESLDGVGDEFGRK
jgi:hypothetical protein